MSIVVTVPHSYCIIGLGHLCDYMAPKAGSLLSNKLNAKIFLADANRTVIDYNRRSSRDSNWRNKIKQFVIENKTKIVLDIHSYPNESVSFGTLNGRIPDIVILDSFNGGNDRLSNEIGTYLNNNGIPTKVLAGGDNDISIEMREIGIQSLLIEFNEGLSEQKLDNICEFLSKKIHM